ncbi:MAG: hypothetical protein ACI93B_000346 [Yoonia sp.]|jgi:hypothetical protein
MHCDWITRLFCFDGIKTWPNTFPGKIAHLWNERNGYPSYWTFDAKAEECTVTGRRGISGHIPTMFLADIVEIRCFMDVHCYFELVLRADRPVRHDIGLNLAVAQYTFAVLRLLGGLHVDRPWRRAIRPLSGTAGS